jgi:DNA-binding NarL/FixJ family response regulator
MCVVSLSPHTTAGHVEFRKKGQPHYWAYDFQTHIWQEHNEVTLRPQEKQVLILSAQGYTVPQIAGKMCRALDTVKTYKRALFERLGARSITEALTVATNQGLL